MPRNNSSKRTHETIRNEQTVGFMDIFLRSSDTFGGFSVLCATKYSACDCYFDSGKSCFKLCAAQDGDELWAYAESAFSCFKQSN